MRRTHQILLLTTGLTAAGVVACTLHHQTVAAVPAPPPVSAHPPATAAAAAAPAPIDFEREVRPIVARCQPCHFEGGKMYAQLPFDDPATIRTLGDKLFTRIKDPAEQDLLRAFFAQSPAS